MLLNIAQRLRDSAARSPWRVAVAAPAGRDRRGRVAYSQLTFQQLDEETDRLAAGLHRLGVRPGHRIVLMVRPSIEFLSLTYALFKVGAVIVLIDPGMGRTNIFQCLELVEPDGFVAIPIVHLLRRLRRGKFPKARFNVTLGRRAWGHGVTYEKLRGDVAAPWTIAPTQATDPAAIIFTSGSTGPPKGVVYEHGMFDAQVDMLRDFYRVEPGEVDLPAFPLFALFNAAMGVTTVVPDMDPTRPAHVNPLRIIEAIRDHGVTQAFGSPALWNRVGRYCVEHGVTFPSLNRGLSAGAPVPMHVLQRMSQVLTNTHADMHTPYGATESLPVASISGREVLHETSALTKRGAGTCVGRPFLRVDVRIVEITDGPIPRRSAVCELPAGEIGEIIVRSPSTTREYFRRPEATALAKIAEDGPEGGFWHRMGDVGSLDASGRLWFCGRKAHIVRAAHGMMFTECVEPIFNEHPRVYRTALVGVPAVPVAGQSQRPVIIVEPEANHMPSTDAAREQFINELRAIGAANPLTAMIDTFLFHPSLPVDIRHNVKIFRERLAPWAEERVKP